MLLPEKELQASINRLLRGQADHEFELVGRGNQPSATRARTSQSCHTSAKGVLKVPKSFGKLKSEVSEKIEARARMHGWPLRK